MENATPVVDTFKEKYFELSDAANLMIDIETLGVSENAHILSIGVCSFSLDDGWIKDGAEAHYRLGISYHNGKSSQNRQIDTSTVDFWRAQPVEVYDRAMCSEMKLVEALAELKNLVSTVTNSDKQVNIWCNGASFDFAILKNAYKQYNLTAPWLYYSENCMRSIKALFKQNDFYELNNIVAKRLTEKGATMIKHDALSDAIWQAEWVATAIKYLRK